MIFNLFYIEDDGFINKEFMENIKCVGMVYGFMFLIVIGLVYFFLKYIICFLKMVSDKIIEICFNKWNKKIKLDNDIL